MVLKLFFVSKQSLEAAGKIVAGRMNYLLGANLLTRQLQTGRGDRSQIGHCPKLDSAVQNREIKI